MITNPGSGGNKKGIGEVRKFLAQYSGIHYGEAVTPDDINALLADFSARNIELLVVNGGDGTVQATLTALYCRSLFASPPILALLQAGTTSMLARDVGVRGKPVAALEKICAWSNDMARIKRHIHERPVLKVSQRDNPDAKCGMFFGAGAIPLGIEICHDRINPNGLRGELIPGLIIARFLLAALTGNDKLLPATDINICIDKTEVKQNSCLLVMVSTLERLFLGLHPFWGREAAPLHFTALQSKPPCLLRNLPSLSCGRSTMSATPENGYISHNARQILLDFVGKFTLDGEIFEAKSPLTIEAAGPARFLRI